MLTLAHELGHGLHAYLARDQGIFHQTTPLTLAETATVFGETVTFGRLLSMVDDPDERFALLAESLEGHIATVFRQVAMNRFEDAVHTHRREHGELSVDDFGDQWARTQGDLLGDAVELTDGYRTWWSYIPHFIGTPGYVYAYAYGQLLALSVYARYDERGDEFVPAVPRAAARRRLPLARGAGPHRRLRPGRPRLLGRRARHHRRPAHRGRAGRRRRRPPLTRSGPRETHQMPRPAARYEIRTVVGAEADRALDLAESVWGQRPLNDAVLRALELAGSYVTVAVDDVGDQLGMCLGIVGVHDDHLHLHSHLAAVDPAHRGAGIGRALKRHQREWCLARGITTISWTFDPLLHANARFNLHHLGARGERYLVELYGVMDDEINRGDASDRLLVRWDLRHPRTLAALDAPLAPPDLDGAVVALADGDGRPVPVPTGAPVRLIATPADAVALRRNDRMAATAWRHAVRETMQQAFADGLEPVALTADGSYVFARPEDR